MWTDKIVANLKWVRSNIQGLIRKKCWYIPSRLVVGKKILRMAIELDIREGEAYVLDLAMQLDYANSIIAILEEVYSNAKGDLPKMFQISNQTLKVIKEQMSEPQKNFLLPFINELSDISERLSVMRSTYANLLSRLEESYQQVKKAIDSFSVKQEEVTVGEYLIIQQNQIELVSSSNSIIELALNQVKLTKISCRCLLDYTEIATDMIQSADQLSGHTRRAVDRDIIKEQVASLGEWFTKVSRQLNYIKIKFQKVLKIQECVICMPQHIGSPANVEPTYLASPKIEQLLEAAASGNPDESFCLNPLEYMPATLEYIPEPLEHTPAPLECIPAPLEHTPAPLEICRELDLLQRSVTFATDDFSFVESSTQLQVASQPFGVLTEEDTLLGKKSDGKEKARYDCTVCWGLEAACPFCSELSESSPQEAESSMPSSMSTWRATGVAQATEPERKQEGGSSLESSSKEMTLYTGRV